MHPSSEKLTFGTSAVFGRSLSGFLIQFLHQHPFSKINMTQTLTLCIGDTTPARSWTSPPSWWPGLCPSSGWRSASLASPSLCRRGWSTGPSPGTSGTSGCTAAPAPGPGAATPSSTRTPPTARACGSWTRALSPASSKSVSKASCCVFSQFSLPSNVEQRVDSSSLFTIKHSQRCCPVRQKVRGHINLLFRESPPIPLLLSWQNLFNVYFKIVTSNSGEVPHCINCSLRCKPLTLATRVWDPG